MTREFTGRHMLAVLVSGFGIVIAVNFTMAGFALGSFSGVVVENSYVASQKYNGWLDRAQAQEKLRWEAGLSRDASQRIVAQTQGVPGKAIVTAELRRPLGDPETRTVVLHEGGAGRFVSREPVAAGRWIVRLRITSNGEQWSMQEELR